MSSLSDMVSAAIAGLLSAALTHFGATDANDKPHKQPPAAHAQPAKTKPDAAPVPAPVPMDDERFAPANPDAAPASARRSRPGHSS